MLLKYRSGVEIADKEKDERFRDYSERSFLDEAANLIALLVLNDRKTDAEKIAKEASAGKLSGSTMLVKILKCEAPSMRADSMISRGSPAM